MKLAYISALLFLIFVAAPKTSFGQVLDSRGKKPIPGVGYFVMPAVPGLSSGLTVSNLKTCKMDVVQTLNPIDLGIPVKFYPWNRKLRFIPESLDLNAKFSFRSRACPKSTVWMVDRTRKEGYVTTGGVQGMPGPTTLNSWFKIEKADGPGYKFVYCPTVCKICQTLCLDLGIYIDKQGNRHFGLVLSDSVVNFVFLKASS